MVVRSGLRGAPRFRIALARRGRFPGRGRAIGCCALGGMDAADLAALLGRDMGIRRSAAGTAFITAAAFLVHRCPGPAFGLLIGHAAMLVAFRDMLGFAVLLVGVFGFIALWHSILWFCTCWRRGPAAPPAQAVRRNSGASAL